MNIFPRSTGLALYKNNLHIRIAYGVNVGGGVQSDLQDALPVSHQYRVKIPTMFDNRSVPPPLSDCSSCRRRVECLLMGR